MRVSVQLRYPEKGGARWAHSVFIDESTRQVVVPIGRLAPADRQAGPAPDPSGAASLLFVVDLTNALPGDAGSFEIGGVRLGR
jgi:hypothetical protein